ncbi:unnamed protein product, partial [Didymodactylos carnosus]
MSSVSISLTSESISSDVPSKIQRGVTMSADEKRAMQIMKLLKRLWNPKTAVNSGQLRKNRRRAAGIGVPRRKTPTTMDKQNKDETIKAPRPVRKRKSSIPKITPDEKIPK